MFTAYWTTGPTYSSSLAGQCEISSSFMKFLDSIQLHICAMILLVLINIPLYFALSGMRFWVIDIFCCVMLELTCTEGDMQWSTFMMSRNRWRIVFSHGDAFNDFFLWQGERY